MLPEINWNLAFFLADFFGKKWPELEPLSQRPSVAPSAGMAISADFATRQNRLRLDSRRKQSYLLPFWQFFGKKWPELESNQRHKDFQSSALPTELSGHR